MKYIHFFIPVYFFASICLAQNESLTENNVKKVLTNISNLFGKPMDIPLAAMGDNTRVAWVNPSGILKYDIDTFEELELNPDKWSYIGVLAHEFGHIYFNNFNSFSDTRNRELKADSLAGYILGALKCPKGKIFDYLEFTESGGDYPTVPFRKHFIEYGYGKYLVSKMDKSIIRVLIYSDANKLVTNRSDDDSELRKLGYSNIKITSINVEDYAKYNNPGIGDGLIFQNDNAFRGLEFPTNLDVLIYQELLSVAVNEYGVKYVSIHPLIDFTSLRLSDFFHDYLIELDSKKIKELTEVNLTSEEFIERVNELRK